jgi:1,2-diacylglycerol 3-alpha-glucosyltransferase
MTNTVPVPALPRVAILFHRFGPYHISRLNAATRHMAVIGIEFSAADPTYAWNDVGRDADLFPRSVVSPDIEAERIPAMIRKVAAVLDRTAPDAVAIAGWSHPGALAALLWCARKRIPAIVMSDSAEIDEKRRPWREAIKRKIVALFSAGLVAGGPHRRYLAALGMDDALIRDGFDTVDNDHFAAGALASRADAKALRGELGLTRPYFMTSCRFVAKKNLFTLLAAYRRYRAMASSSAWDLVLLGDGPLAAELHAAIAGHGLEAFVHLPGFLQYEELPRYYGLASAFVLPSTTEQWGLVVNEAMAAGLPILVSTRCGCAEDLVRSGVNGFPFDPFNVTELSETMQSIASANVDREAMGKAGQAMIAEWSTDRFARELRHAVDGALASPQQAPDRIGRWLAALLLCRTERTDG